MRYYRLIIIVSTCLTGMAVAAQVPGKDAAWGLPEFEESFTTSQIFTGTSFFSRTLMENGSGMHSGHDTCYQELQLYRTGNLSVDTSGSGILTITARLENEPVEGLVNPYLPGQDTLCDGRPNYRNFRYTSGRLITIQRFPYGFFEARLCPPRIRGMWPAFWLHYATGDCNTGKEIDIFEPDGEDSSSGNTYGTNYHYNFGRDSICYNDSQAAVNITAGEEGFLSSGFHVYGLEWSPGKAVFYLDGQAVRTVKSKSLPSHPMHLNLNLAVDPWNPPPDGFTEAGLLVDYIRVYTLKCDPSRSARLQQRNYDRFENKLYRSVTVKHLSVSSALTLRATEHVLLKRDVEVEPGTEFCILPMNCY